MSWGGIVLPDGSPPETTCISVTLPISKSQGTVLDESLFPVHLQPSSCSRPALLTLEHECALLETSLHPFELRCVCVIKPLASRLSCCFLRCLCLLSRTHCALFVVPCRFALFVRSLFVEPLSCSRFVCVCEVRPEPVPGRTELVLTHLTV